MLCRMYPKYKLDDSLNAIERLGKKREMAIHMTRYRLGQLTKDDEVLVASDEEDNVAAPREDEPMDEFEALIDEQIALSTVNQSRTAHDKSFGNISGIFSSTKIQDRSFGSTQQASQSKSQYQSNTQPSQPPKTQVSAQPPKTQVPAQPTPEITDEMRAKIAENRMRALAIQAQRRKEAEEKARKEQEEQRKKSVPEISNILIDDDF